MAMEIVRGARHTADSDWRLSGQILRPDDNSLLATA